MQTVLTDAVKRRSLRKEVLGDPGVGLRLGAYALNVVVIDTQLDLGCDFMNRSELYNGSQKVS
jgi:hypothetical protein